MSLKAHRCIASSVTLCQSLPLGITKGSSGRNTREENSPFFSVLGIEPRVLGMPGTHSTTESGLDRFYQRAGSSG